MTDVISADSVKYICKQLANAIKTNRKLRAVGANFGITLYDNPLYQDTSHNIKYISLARFEFTPYVTLENTLICHPNNSLAKCYKAAHEKQRMIYGTPLYYKITIGGAIMNGAIGSHIPSTNVAAHVKKLWIVDGTGKAHVITGEELGYFRATFGYLGLVYQIELNTFPEQFFKIEKYGVNAPFTRNTHISQLVLHNPIPGVINDNSNKPYEYVDIVLQPVEAPSASQQMRNMIDLKLQNIEKNAEFLIDGSISIPFKSILTGFYNLFIPQNDSIVNSYGLVKAFPLIPKTVLKYIPLYLECSVYFDVIKFPLALPIILRHYENWYGLTLLGNDYDCINIVIRKVFPNFNCEMDMTNGTNFSTIPQELVCVDMGFYGSKIHTSLLDAAVSELLPYTYGYHLGKYVSDDIIEFARNIFSSKMSRMAELKAKYDPNHVFSTTKLDKLFKLFSGGASAACATK